LGLLSALIAEGRYKRRIIRFLHTGDAPDVLNIMKRKRKLKIKLQNLKKEYGNWKNRRKTMKWFKHDEWKHGDAEECFSVMVVKWDCGTEKMFWNKYLYLFPGNKHFGKYRPKENESYPKTPFDFHCGITYYSEDFDKDGNLSRQTFGDDYNHLWDQEYPVDSDGSSVFKDAEALIEQVKSYGREEN
jgi:hypothetical protein